MNTSVSEQQEQYGTKTGVRYHFAAVVLLACMVYFLLDSATDDNVARITSLSRIQEQEYDYFMDDVDSVHYTGSGQADYRFQALQLTHFPNPEYSTIESPRFTLFKDSNSGWQITSETGRIEMDPVRDQEKLVLNTDVVIEGQTPEGAPVNIYTRVLTIYPEDRFITSEAEVIIEAEGYRSTSTGFSVDLNTNQIRQFANGQMQYD